MRKPSLRQAQASPDLLRVALIAACIAACPLFVAAQDAPAVAALLQEPDKLMLEEHRLNVKKIVVLPGKAPARNSVTGSYEEETDGLLDGIARGAEMAVIRRDIYGIPLGIPIPVLQIPGMIFGGLKGSVQREIQDFRDALANDLKDASNSPLSNDALATDVFWGLRDVPGLEPKVFAHTTPIPPDTEAILYVGFTDSSINVDGNAATVTFSASATLRRLSDGQHLYENIVHYQDSDTLSNWTKDDNAAWQNYANYARHYVGREIVAELYERVALQQSLQPLPTEVVKPVKDKKWAGVTKSTSPTLAWSHELPSGEGQAEWAADIELPSITYDLEIYDEQQLIYSAKDFSGRQHTVEYPLPDCKTYRWSVRPHYTVDGAVRTGEWMRSNTDNANGNYGKASSVASAYIYDFAQLDVRCARR